MALAEERQALTVCGIFLSRCIRPHTFPSIKVFIVDDSTIIRLHLAELLMELGAIEIAARSDSAYEAAESIRQLELKPQKTCRRNRADQH